MSNRECPNKPSLWRACHNVGRPPSGYVRYIQYNNGEWHKTTVTSGCLSCTHANNMFSVSSYKEDAPNPFILFNTIRKYYEQ